VGGHPRSEALAFWARLSAEYTRYQEAIRVLPIEQAKVQDDLRRYLCLRCAGFLEQVTFIVIHGYLEQKAGGPALSFAQSWFERAPNLTSDAFAKLINRFGKEHSDAFELFLTPVRRESLGDLLAIRNDVAHGKHFAGQRLQPDRYVALCEETYEWLVATFLGTGVEVLDETGRQVVAYERTPQ
jgi:hypothetical protein